MRKIVYLPALFWSEIRIVNLFTFEKRTGAERSTKIMRGFKLINSIAEVQETSFTSVELYSWKTEIVSLFLFEE